MEDTPVVVEEADAVIDVDDTSICTSTSVSSVPIEKKT